MRPYFGYGSNLDAEDLADWCRERDIEPIELRLVSPAWLPDHTVIFPFASTARRGGVLSVEERIGCAVPGALFTPDARAWEVLDLKEGAPDWYGREDVTVIDASGDEVEAITYVVTPAHREGHFEPGGHYLGTVVRGLRELGHPTEQVEAAARNAEAHHPGLLFVYGSLLSGGSRSRVVGAHSARLVGGATTRGELVDCGEYPGLVAGDGEVFGELYEIGEPGPIIRDLDEIEAFAGFGAEGSLFRRTLVPTSGGVAWTYRLAGGAGDLPRIRSGRWIEG